MYDSALPELQDSQKLGPKTRGAGPRESPIAFARFDAAPDARIIASKRVVLEVIRNIFPPLQPIAAGLMRHIRFSTQL